MSDGLVQFVGLLESFFFFFNRLPFELLIRNWVSDVLFFPADEDHSDFVIIESQCKDD